MPLTQEENERLTRVGPGTPMGELLRRYWHPIAAVAELDEQPLKPVRVLGEDLVVYRARDGRYGVIQRHCPHRRADFRFGYVEQEGIRCSYHGWKYGLDGQCLQMPYEDAAGSTVPFREAARARAYRCEAKAGMVWVYLGPPPVPLIPTWEPFTFENCFRQIVFHHIHCNWLQCQENAIDPVHFEWLHDNALAGRAGDEAGYRPGHVRLDFEAWEFGFQYRRLHQGEDETSDSWKDARLCILPNVFAPVHIEWRVPIDDENTLNVSWHFTRVPVEMEPFEQATVPYWWGQLHDPDTGERLVGHVMNQDLTSFVGQGRIADRTLELLGRSDRGIVLLRRQLEADLRAVTEGRDPTGVVRDPEQNAVILWPNDVRKRYLRGSTVSEVHARLRRLKRLAPGSGPDEWFFFSAGQPEAVRSAFNKAMGFEG